MTPDRADLIARVDRLIWDNPAEPRPRWQDRLQRLLRTVLMLARDVVQGQLTLRAMSLVYTTLLSIVPLLALSFSVLKAFGVHNQVRPLLQSLLEPLGEKSAELAGRISGFIENMNVGVLGALGLGLLLYTAISLIQKIEESLNFIWHVSQPRSLGERFSRYLSVLLVGPILVFSALGVTASVMNIDLVRQMLEVDLLGQAVQVASRLAPYALVIAAFTFVYLFIPNTRVRFGAALVGGTVGGIAWQTAGWLFATFVATSGQYAAIYSGFAVVVLFMIWLYVSWLVLLFGASVAFYIQHPEYLHRGVDQPRLSPRVRERLALSAMTLMAGRFIAGEAAMTAQALAAQLGVPLHVLHRVLDALEAGALVVQTASDPPCYLPAQDPGAIHVAQVLGVVRSAGEARFIAPANLPTPTAVDALLNRLQSEIDASVGAVSLRELAVQAPDPAAEAAAPTAA